MPPHVTPRLPRHRPCAGQMANLPPQKTMCVLGKEFGLPPRMQLRSSTGNSSSPDETERGRQQTVCPALHAFCSVLSAQLPPHVTCSPPSSLSASDASSAPIHRATASGSLILATASISRGCRWGGPHPPNATMRAWQQAAASTGDAPQRTPMTPLNCNGTSQRVTIALSLPIPAASGTASWTRNSKAWRIGSSVSSGAMAVKGRSRSSASWGSRSSTHSAPPFPHSVPHLSHHTPLHHLLPHHPIPDDAAQTLTHRRLSLRNAQLYFHNPKAAPLDEELASPCSLVDKSLDLDLLRELMLFRRRQGSAFASAPLRSRFCADLELCLSESAFRSCEPSSSGAPESSGSSGADITRGTDDGADDY